MSEKLAQLMQRGCEILDCKYAVLGGAMTWVSDAHLVSAISNSGAFGVLAGGAMSAEQLGQQISDTQAKTKHTFGVNIILAHPELQDLIDVCGEKKVTHLFFAGGIVDKNSIEKAHQYGIKCFGFAPTLALAKRMIKNGVDGLVIEGHEAGGHIGPVSTLVLVQEILLNLKDFPIIVAGGIVRGEVFAALLSMGACACQLGTAFACCKESNAHSNFKEAFLKANSRDAVISVQLDRNFPVTSVRALQNEAYKEFMQKQKNALFKFESGELSLDEARLSLEKFWAGALRRAVIEGDIDHGSIMAGQSVGLVKEELSIDQILENLMNEANSYLEQFK